VTRGCRSVTENVPGDMPSSPASRAWVCPPAISDQSSSCAGPAEISGLTAGRATQGRFLYSTMTAPLTEHHQSG